MEILKKHYGAVQQTSQVSLIRFLARHPVPASYKKNALAVTRRQGGGVFFRVVDIGWLEFSPVLNNVRRQCPERERDGPAPTCTDFA